MEQTNLVGRHSGRGALLEPQEEQAEGAGFIGDKVNDTTILALELLGGLADLPAENDLNFVKLLGEPLEASLIRESQQDGQVRLAMEGRQLPGKSGFHIFHDEGGVEVLSQSTGVEHAGDHDAIAGALDDAERVEDRLAGGLVQQIGAEDGDGGGTLEGAKLGGGEPGLAVADIKRVVMHGGEGAQHITVLDEVIILAPAGGIADVHADCRAWRFGVEHGLEPRQSAELAGEAPARLEPPVRVAGEEDGQVNRGPPRRPPATARQHQAREDEDEERQVHAILHAFPPLGLWVETAAEEEMVFDS